MKLKITLLALLCLFFKASAQSFTGASEHELKVGDHVPDITIANIINYNSASVKPSDFKNKILLLDFWSTWCSACVGNFPHLYSLQQKMPDELQILLINCKSTKDNLAKLQSYFNKRKNYYQLPCVVEDTVLDKMFPHQTIPHYVWIKNSKVIAITYAPEVNEKNIRSVFEAGRVKIIPKPHINYDDKESLLNLLKGSQNQTDFYHSVLLPYQPSMLFHEQFRYTDDLRVTGIEIVNCSKINLLKLALGNIGHLQSDRIIIDGMDPAGFLADSTAESWKAKNCFCYEALFPACNREEAVEFFRQDFTRFLQVKIDSVERDMDCYVLTIADSGKITKAKQGTKVETNIFDNTGAPVFYSNYSVKDVLYQLESKYQVPFIDETGLVTRVNLQLPANYRDEESLMKAFTRQGFQLKRSKRKLRCLVISNQLAYPATAQNH